MQVQKRFTSGGNRALAIDPTGLLQSDFRAALRRSFSKETRALDSIPRQSRYQWKANLHRQVQADGGMSCETFGSGFRFLPVFRYTLAAIPDSVTPLARKRAIDTTLCTAVTADIPSVTPGETNMCVRGKNCASVDVDCLRVIWRTVDLPRADPSRREAGPIGSPKWIKPLIQSSFRTARRTNRGHGVFSEGPAAVAKALEQCTRRIEGCSRTLIKRSAHAAVWFLARVQRLSLTSFSSASARLLSVYRQRHFEICRR